MNYHSDEWINKNLREHLNEALNYFPEHQIVGIFYQGSGNYGLDTENSDVDTKLVVVPTFRDIALNAKPVSTTHIRENNEHIDFKDVRLMLQTFRKQNINFLEILFTRFKWINPIYENEWMRLVDKREDIARYNKLAAVKTIKGMAFQKVRDLEHEFPSKIEMIRAYGYDAKQLHTLLRLEEFLIKYIEGDKYEDCLHSKQCSFLKQIKRQGNLSLEEAHSVAQMTLDNIVEKADRYCDSISAYCNQEVDKLLDDVQCNIMRIAVLHDLKGDEA